MIWKDYDKDYYAVEPPKPTKGISRKLQSMAETHEQSLNYLKERESARPIYAAWDRVSASELEFDGEWDRVEAWSLDQ